MTDTRPNYERLIERISDPHCAVDAEWQITYWNEQMAAWSETPATKAEGNLLWDVFPVFRGSALESHCRDAVATQESRSIETLLREPVESRISVHLYPGEDGLSIIVRDGDERPGQQSDVELAETVFENTQDALFLVDVDEAEDEFRLERVNPVYETHTGLTNDELRGRRLQAVFTPEEGERILENYRQCVARNEPLEYEEVLSVPDERSYWETRISPVVVDGAIVKLVGATRNVTEQKERERQYDAIFNQTYQFTGLLDPDGTLLKANDTALEFGGFGREDVIGRPVWESEWWQIDAETQERLQDAIEVAATGEFVRYDETVQGADETVVVDFSLRPITDERGDVVLIVAEGRDITALKRRTRELEQKREFLRHIQSVADIGGWEVDFRTETMRWTDEVYRIHELPPEYEPTIEDGIDFYHPRDRARITAAFERLWTTGDDYDLELRIVTHTDETRWVRTVGTPWYDDDGNLTGARGAFQDITERKERERELQRTNARLEEFTSIVSHDLRNPLTVAQAALELGRESCSSADFDRIEAAHERMNALITDLLTLARRGQQVDETESVALEPLVESLCETVPSNWETLEVDLGDHRVEADESRLRQLIENLLSNAVTHGGEDVTIRIGPLEDDDGFYLADDGPGIPPTQRQEIFDRGYSTTGEGTGFGLAIVRSIADAHGWTVEATESTDGGAQFEINTEPPTPL
ncbi:PAS domain-containing sensor histidine kinase [Natronobacterium gregoryi]|uniref:histidine kinase n=2 Tax=Natronobacterium gregoryi TaxID=44930 RepID=L0AHT4_NATGS|nr:PAS domain-containing protein [Natronobacterium gregoryi]AFZ73371.1 PAS domain S-box [Natronobacterium gregoryi SP2]ELY68567.1 multi-sensor signal transduction histidine kinase [Natronobacterium gregoryi SP2]PLK19652.1 PAS domain S-box protein [Natronobacterium gregoryi SP2]SFI73830.1 PAS domain S-box-containing protein [Natronobacterium gregoryi]